MAHIWRAALAVTMAIIIGACSAQTDKSPQAESPDTVNKTEKAKPIASVIKAPDGSKLGTVAITDLGKGGVSVTVLIENIAPGTHAMHFHEIGKCEAPDFKSSGGHYNPDGKAHGMKMADGPHVGDMMNIDVDADGNGVFSVVNDRVSLNGDYGLPALLDNDGTALVLHALADDYESQPSGAAGARIGCSVIGE